MKKTYTIVTVFILILICTTTVFSQTTANTEVLTNATIIKMKQAGFGSEVIKAKIEASPCIFATDMNALMDLKAAKVDDDIISAMVKKSTTPTVSTIPKEKWGKMLGDTMYVSLKGKPYKIGQTILLGNGSSPDGSFRYVTITQNGGAARAIVGVLGHAVPLDGRYGSRPYTIKKIECIRPDGNPFGPKVNYLEFEFTKTNLYKIDLENALNAKEVIEQ